MTTTTTMTGVVCRRERSQRHRSHPANSARFTVAAARSVISTTRRRRPWSSSIIALLHVVAGCVAWMTMMQECPLRASAAAAEAGTTPEGPVGDALKAWIDASEGVELEGVYIGDANAQSGSSGLNDDDDDDGDEHGASAFAAAFVRGSRGRNVGVFAARDGGLEEGEAYIAVPWRLVMGEHAIAHRPALQAVMTQLRAEFGADDKSVLLLILVHERFVSPHDSPWRGYLAALPEPAAAPDDDDGGGGGGFDTPLYWPPSLLRELAGSAALDDAISEQAKVRAVYRGFNKRVFSLHPDIFPPGKATLPALMWAWSVVHSRASTVPGKGLVLVPLADMVNDAGPVADAAGGGSNPGGRSRAAAAEFVVYDVHYDRAVVYAKRSYAPGEEVTESYGEWSMADTLMSAGYLPSLSRSAAVAAAAAAAAAVAAEAAAAASSAGKEQGNGDGEARDGRRVDEGVDGFLGSDCVVLSLVPPAAGAGGRVNGSTADRAAGAGAGAGAGAAAEDEQVVGLEGKLREAGFEVPWRVCLSAARGTRTARLIAQWAAICASAGANSVSGGGGASPGRLAAGVLRGVLTQRLRSYPTTVEEDEDALQMYRDEVESLSSASASASSSSSPDSSMADNAAVRMRARQLARVSLATELRAREKRVLSRVVADLDGAAEGDAFAWATPPRARAADDQEGNGEEEDEEEEERKA